jgi:hypothetical protein
MLCKTLIIAAVALTAMTGIAGAQMPERSRQSPLFTAEEVVVISRNAGLLEGLRTDPWAIRDFLDKMAKAPARAGMGTKKLKLDDEPPQRGAAPAFDPKQNPDLDQYQRASPEAVHDLFQLIKRAGERRPPAK